MHSDRIVLLIVLLYCVLAILYAVLTPPWESPDEPAHYRYVSQLAARWRPPPDSTIRQRDSFAKDYPFISSNYEWYQPALGYLPAAITYKVLESFFPTSLPREIPILNPLFSTNPIAHPHLFLHANLRPFCIWGDQWGLLVIRIISALWGLVVIYSAYHLGLLLDQTGTLGVVAAGWLAFLPQFTFINASIRSDTLANAIAALVLLLAVSLQTGVERKNNYAIVLGILLGLGLLTKHTFLYMVPVGLLAVVLTAPRSPRTWIRSGMYVLIPALVLWGGYHLAYSEARAALVYTFNTALKIRPDALSWSYLTKIPEPLLIDLFYARFGWANVISSTTWSRLAFGIWVVGASITAAQTLRLLRKPAQQQSLQIITLLGVSLFLAVLGVVRFNLSVFQPQGRLLFPVLAAWAIVGFWGAWQVLSTRGKTVAGFAAIGFMLTFDLYSLSILVRTYY